MLMLTTVRQASSLRACQITLAWASSRPMDVIAGAGEHNHLHSRPPGIDESIVFETRLYIYIYIYVHIYIYIYIS